MIKKSTHSFFGAWLFLLVRVQLGKWDHGSQTIKSGHGIYHGPTSCPSCDLGFIMQFKLTSMLINNPRCTGNTYDGIHMWHNVTFHYIFYLNNMFLHNDIHCNEFNLCVIKPLNMLQHSPRKLCISYVNQCKILPFQKNKHLHKSHKQFHWLSFSLALTSTCAAIVN